MAKPDVESTVVFFQITYTFIFFNIYSIYHVEFSHRTSSLLVSVPLPCAQATP